MISRGNFSFGSWCHFVGTGGGTVLDAWAGGLDKRLANDGFSEQTAERVACCCLASVPPPRGSLAARLTDCLPLPPTSILLELPPPTVFIECISPDNGFSALVMVDIEADELDAMGRTELVTFGGCRLRFVIVVCSP